MFSVEGKWEFNSLAPREEYVPRMFENEEL
jgi:hypothetical protein